MGFSKKTTHYNPNYPYLHFLKLERIHGKFYSFTDPLSSFNTAFLRVEVGTRRPNVPDSSNFFLECHFSKFMAMAVCLSLLYKGCIFNSFLKITFVLFAKY